uniref:Uncharacterized protein n=1 Tax=Panagrolaimus davidi TaxID=227884 RepID=A0A914QPF8_9BILA
MYSKLPYFIFITFFFAIQNSFAVRSPKFELKTQYEASCFPKCTCNQTTVECKNLNEIKTDVFEHILPKIWPELDTVSITGNDLGDLPNENLFGDRNRHLRLTLLDLSDNDIRSFSAETFFGAPKVQYLYLRNNEITSVGSKPFDYMPLIRVIDLTAGFAEGVSGKKKGEIIGDMLESGHHFKHLQELILNANGLIKLDSEMFCTLENLGRLILADNLFESLDLNVKCLPSLRHLDLRNNRFEIVPAFIYKGGLDLNAIDISQNPLKCDCKMEEFIKFANDDSTIFLDQGKTICKVPTELAGKGIFEIDTETTNLCQRGSRLLHWIILILIAGGCFYVYRHLRRAGKLPRMPTVFGYSQLKSNDEMNNNYNSSNNQPAFV